MHRRKINIQNLNTSEITEINGGIPLIPAGLALWFGNEIINNWSDVKSGIADAYRDFSGTQD